MNFELPIGTRGHVADFLKIFTIDFLNNNNLNFYTSALSSVRIIGALTKYGEVVVQYDDVLTYLGKGKWDVRQEKKDE